MTGSGEAAENDRKLGSAKITAPQRRFFFACRKFKRADYQKNRFGVASIKAFYRELWLSNNYC